VRPSDVVIMHSAVKFTTGQRRRAVEARTPPPDSEIPQIQFAGWALPGTSGGAKALPRVQTPCPQ